MAIKDVKSGVKSQLGQPATLVNASVPTNFTYLIEGIVLSDSQIDTINNERLFSKKIEILKSLGGKLVFERIENKIFNSNLKTIDYYFDNILATLIVMYYSNSNSKENTIANFVARISEQNPLDYDLTINDGQYQLMMRKFLTDYALGMRASEVWKRDYQATGGYLVVRKDGELICYHFYFAKQFEEYLFNNTKFDTGDKKRNDFGYIYNENNCQKIKLNLQIRFIK
ncbi:MAG: HpaII family restriction endonuclease [Prolixibacteraceae bacterium]